MEFLVAISIKVISNVGDLFINAHYLNDLLDLMMFSQVGLTQRVDQYSEADSCVCQSPFGYVLGSFEAWCFFFFVFFLRFYVFRALVFEHFYSPQVFFTVLSSVYKLKCFPISSLIAKVMYLHIYISGS